ncbi:MAG TPA: hypothetical protein VNZ50_07575 [Hyphomicrobiaceae bacterium]|nr:hypothetical protein [Hyphomicrobiaceae bacterium]
MASTTLKGAIAGLAACAALAVGAEAQSQGKLSDKSVHTLMEYAWQILPSKFTTPEGKVIEVDKTKRDGNIVPVENGREIIRVGYSSAQAQVCELWEEQQANYDALMRREVGKKKWTDQQLLYITTLHRMTIHAVAGKLKVEEKAGELKVILEPIKPGEVKCSDEQKNKIRESIQALVAQDAPAGKEAAAEKKAPAAPKKK